MKFDRLLSMSLSLVHVSNECCICFIEGDGTQARRNFFLSLAAEKGFDPKDHSCWEKLEKLAVITTPVRQQQFYQSLTSVEYNP